jgi:hypothetical protein
MRMTILIRYSIAPIVILMILAGSFFIMSSCSGGGGGDSGSGGGGGIPYTGLTTQAYITSANANKFFSLIWNGVPSSVSISPVTAVSKTVPPTAQEAAVSRNIVDRLKVLTLSDLMRFVTRSTAIIRATTINESHAGSVSGTLTITGDIDPNTFTGNLTMIYVNFNDGDGYTSDGTVLFKLDSYDLAYGIITDGTMSFTLWTIKSAGSDVSMSGSIRMQESLQNNNDTVTVNVNGRNNMNKDAYRFENFVVTTLYNNVLAPTSGSETLSGRVYDGPYGYVDVSTNNPFVYSSYPQENPDSGGLVNLSGAGNTGAAVAPISTSYVKIMVDADGDSVYESKNAYAWYDLAGSSVLLAPVANAGLDQAVATGAIVTLNGSGSADPLGDSLTYTWTMTGAPGGSLAILSSPSSNTTTFGADMPGAYTITLSVSNGKISSSPDMVIVNATGPANSFFFGPYVAYPTGSWPTAVAIGDVTGDGKNDIVLTTSYYFDPAHDYHLFVYAQDDAGNLKTAVTYTTAGTYTNAPQTVAIGDINNDGKNEIVVGNSGLNIEVFVQDGAGGLVSSVTYSTINSYKIKIADLNHDGRLDVVGMGWGTDTVDVFLQNANGTLNPPVIYDVKHGGYDDLAVGDVNNDGLTDIVVMSGQSYADLNIGVLIQKSDGTFNPPVHYSVGTNILTSGVAAGDVNGDSLQDIVVTYGFQIGVFLQNSSGTLNSVTNYSANGGAGQVRIADINNDNRKDVIVAHGGWSTLGVYIQNESGTLQPEEYYPVPSSTSDIAVGDINSDGANDIVIADYGNGLVVLYHK